MNTNIIKEPSTIDFIEIKEETQEPVIRETIQTDNNSLFESQIFNKPLIQTEESVPKSEWNINDRRGNRTIEQNNNEQNNNEKSNNEKSNERQNNERQDNGTNEYGMHILENNEELTRTINELEKEMNEKLRNRVLELLKEPHPELERYFDEKKKKKSTSKPKKSKPSEYDISVNKRADTILKCIIDSLRTMIQEKDTSEMECDAIRKVLLSLGKIKYDECGINTNIWMKKSFTKTVIDIDAKLDFIMQILQY